MPNAFVVHRFFSQPVGPGLPAAAAAISTSASTHSLRGRAAANSAAANTANVSSSVPAQSRRIIGSHSSGHVGPHGQGQHTYSSQPLPHGHHLHAGHAYQQVAVAAAAAQQAGMPPRHAQMRPQQLQPPRANTNMSMTAGSPDMSAAGQSQRKIPPPSKIPAPSTVSTEMPDER